MALIHFIIRGYKADFEKLKVLIKYKMPAYLCLQETYHGTNVPYPPSRYIYETVDPVVAYNPRVRPQEVY